jgi:POT family proton-dependent oligopeptide transporter
MTTTSVSTPPSNPGHERELFGHPRGLFVLFLTEMWERFSFYSMRAFLVLYMTKALAFSEKNSNEIYGAYLGFVYAAPFVGGMLADRLLGQRRAIVIGGILMALAQYTLAVHAHFISSSPDVVSLNMLFFLGLGMLAAGNGFFKPNISTIVGSLYEQNDPRRDGAFTIFYMGINIGAWLAGISGQIAESYGWHWGFLIAGTGMLIGQVIFSIGKGWLRGKGLPPVTVAEASGRRPVIPYWLMMTIGVAVFIPLSAILMSQPRYVQGLAVFVAVPILAYLLWEAFRSDRVEAGRMIVIIILCMFSMMFWAFFELAGSAINLFADQKVNRVIPWGDGERELAASLLTASINPFFIILMGIPFAKLWVWLDKKRMEPSSPLKFALGLLQLGAGFFVMYLGAVQAVQGGPDGRCNISYLILGFYLHTTGELCLSPVGLSTITKLAPLRLVGTFMGVWFLSSSLGNVLGGVIGGLTEQHGFDVVFKWIAISAVVAGVLLILLVRPLKKMMHGVK